MAESAHESASCDRTSRQIKTLVCLSAMRVFFILLVYLTSSTRTQHDLHLSIQEKIRCFNSKVFVESERCTKAMPLRKLSHWGLGYFEVDPKVESAKKVCRRYSRISIMYDSGRLATLGILYYLEYGTPSIFSKYLMIRSSEGDRTSLTTHSEKTRRTFQECGERERVLSNP